MGRGPGAPGVARGPGQEPPVIVVAVASEAQHGPTRGPVLRGQPPCDPRDGDEDDADSCKWIEMSNVWSAMRRAGVARNSQE